MSKDLVMATFQDGGFAFVKDEYLNLKVLQKTRRRPINLISFS